MPKAKIHPGLPPIRIHKGSERGTDRLDPAEEYLKNSESPRKRRKSFKARTTVAESTLVPEEKSVPDTAVAEAETVNDDTNVDISTHQKFTKPSVSFSSLIKEAILASTHKRLLLHEIYHSICRFYPYFVTAGEGWKNSVRHNLSINSMFCKIPRDIIDNMEKDQQRTDITCQMLEEEAEQAIHTRAHKKGCYWIIRNQRKIGRSHSGPVEDRRGCQSVVARPTPDQCTFYQHTRANTVKIQPYTRVSNFLGWTRRDSEPYMPYLHERSGKVASVCAADMHQDVEQRISALQPGRARAMSLYHMDSGEQSLAEIQPLQIEEYLSLDESWLNTSTIRSASMVPMTMDQMSHTEPLDDMSWLAPRYSNQQLVRGFQQTNTYYPEAYDSQSVQYEPDLYVHNTTGPPQLLPRRPIKDVWLGATCSIEQNRL